MKQVFRVMEVIEERTLECVCSVQRVARRVSSNTTRCECVREDSSGALNCARQASCERRGGETRRGLSAKIASDLFGECVELRGAK